MTDDPFSAGFTRFSRSMMLPWRFLPRQPGEASFDALRRGNAALDTDWNEH